MRILLVGATGAVGRRLAPLLVEAGHAVVGTTSTPAKARGDLVALDLLDRDAVRAVVEAAAPDVIVHEATALAGFTDLRRFEREFELTNRLRSEGTDNLLAAAPGVPLVAQSYTGWTNGSYGPPVHTEEDALDPDPPAAFRATLAAIRHLESAATTALRYGGLYGPGTTLAPGGAHAEAVRKRRFPIVGDGGGIWSFVHVDDAAAATALAVERGARGIFNVVDDDPAPVAEWLPHLARVLGAEPPRRVPVWLGRLAVGKHGVAMMTSIRGASNENAKRELGWTPRYPSWRDGFAEVFGAKTAADHGSPEAPTETSGFPSQAA
jgi:nucleoside-diphosphate-sugar epimerase